MIDYSSFHLYLFFLDRFFLADGIFAFFSKINLWLCCVLSIDNFTTWSKIMKIIFKIFNFNMSRLFSKLNGKLSFENDRFICSREFSK